MTLALVLPVLPAFFSSEWMMHAAKGLQARFLPD